MFRTLIYPSSGACDFVDELPHRSSCSQFVVCWSFWCGWFWVVFVLQASPKTSRTKSSNTQRTESKTTDVLIHQHSRKLLKMDILMSETCWAHKKWNKIASDIKLVFHSSTIAMMHGPINIKKSVYLKGINYKHKFSRRLRRNKRIKIKRMKLQRHRSLCGDSALYCCHVHTCLFSILLEFHFKSHCGEWGLALSWINHMLLRMYDGADMDISCFFSTLLFFNSPGMTFRKWWDAEYVYITGPPRVSKTAEAAYEWDMGKYITKSTVHALSSSINGKISPSHYVLGRFM